MSEYPFNTEGPPTSEELRFIAKKLRESDGKGMFPKFLCEIYADEADRQADANERMLKFLEGKS